MWNQDSSSFECAQTERLDWFRSKPISAQVSSKSRVKLSDSCVWWQWRWRMTRPLQHGPKTPETCLLGYKAPRTKFWDDFILWPDRNTFPTVVCGKEKGVCTNGPLHSMPPHMHTLASIYISKLTEPNWASYVCIVLSLPVPYYSNEWAKYMTYKAHP